MRIEDSIYRYGTILQKTEEKNKPSNSDNPEKTGLRSFEEIMRQKLSNAELIFSKHAQERLQKRNIELSENDIEKLNTAVRKASEKGVDNTLVLSDKGAFIVNTSNNIVITAMGESDIKDNVFTQIDGAVII